jgi:Ca2+-binding RTX toxin-like protein
VLDGGAGADTLAGGAGNDGYVVDDAGDVVTELAGCGTDTVSASIGWTLADKANLEHLTLTGGADIDATGNGQANVLTGNGGANVLDGGAGNDTLDGGAGADTMTGGTGNDTYLVDDGGDVVTEESALAAELDLVKSGVDFVLGSNLEHLTLTGTGDIDGTGNGLANLLLGNDGANVLDGQGDRKSTRLNSSHNSESRMPSSRATACAAPLPTVFRSTR